MKKDKTQILKENEALYQETLNEFCSKPYDLASVNEIIKRSKFNKGSFYYRFKDKYELYTALIDYIYVQQIDLFREKGFSLIDYDNLLDILKLMFTNLIDLYNKDERFYQVIQYLYRDKSGLLSKVKKDSLDSLYNRFLIKLKTMDDYNLEIEEIIKSLYLSFPIDKIVNNTIQLDYLLELMNPNQMTELKPSKTNNKDELSNQILERINDKFNYFIGDFSSLDLSFNNYNIYQQLKSVSSLQNSLKLKSINPFLNTETLLNKYKRKPIFNGLAVEKLLEKDNFLLIKEDELLRDITFLVVYAIIDLNEYIVFDDFVNYLNIRQLDILFDLIIPITGKLSKIVFLDQYLYLNQTKINNYYVVNSISQLEPFKLKDSFNDFNRIYHIKYTKNNKIFNEYYDDFKNIIDVYNDKLSQIITVQTIKKMSYHQLIESR